MIKMNPLEKMLHKTPKVGGTVKLDLRHITHS